MSLETIKVGALTNTIRPSFPSTERLIRRNTEEISYVPASQLPVKVTVALTNDQIEFFFEYSLNEETVEKIINEDITVKIGAHTGRIVYLKAAFKENEFPALLSRFKDIRSCFKGLGYRAEKETVKKSYDIISKLTEQIKQNFIIKNQKTIVDAFNENAQKQETKKD